MLETLGFLSCMLLLFICLTGEPSTFFFRAECFPCMAFLLLYPRTHCPVDGWSRMEVQAPLFIFFPPDYVVFSSDLPVNIFMDIFQSITLVSTNFVVYTSLKDTCSH